MSAFDYRLRIYIVQKSMKALTKLLKDAALSPEDIAKQITGEIKKDDPMYKVHMSKMKRLRLLLRF